ncbi:MAG: Tol-Pal system protein TolB, partial [Pseudomonadota bacterium]|nr:Tol-Pal system protein TolB [Pseudomonadota bacterium]
MISRILAPLLAPLLTGAALIATPLSAQNQDLGEAPPEGGVIETVDEGEGLNVSVSYEGRLDDLGIAIPAFATDRNV